MIRGQGLLGLGVHGHMGKGLFFRVSRRGGVELRTWDRHGADGEMVHSVCQGFSAVQAAHTILSGNFAYGGSASQNPGLIPELIQDFLNGGWGGTGSDGSLHPGHGSAIGCKSVEL